MTKSLTDIAKEQGAKTHGYLSCYLQEHGSILFENEAQLRATIDAVNAQKHCALIEQALASKPKELK